VTVDNCLEIYLWHFGFSINKPQSRIFAVKYVNLEAGWLQCVELNYS
jgi:hypothetical protein